MPVELKTALGAAPSLHRPLHRLRALMLALAAMLALTGVATVATAKPTTLTVFAAASLSEGFTELGRQFEHAHPGVRVQFNFAGSQQLVAQLEQGAKADLFASADTRWMDELVAHDRVAGAPRWFARNRLAVIVPATNPARISRLDQLARPGIKLVLGADAVPVGRYSRAVLERIGAAAHDPDYLRRVLANRVSEEESVRGVVGKVQLGEADAGMVYRSDVGAAVKRYVRVIAIPDSVNVVASYPLAVLRDAPAPELARAFAEFVCSAAGQKTLSAHGFMPATP